MPEQGDTSNSIKNCCFNDFETCESIRIVIHMNRLLCAPLVFSSSSLKQQHGLAPFAPGAGFIWVCDVSDPGSNSL